ncbi:MAG: DUF3189 family protein [Dethiobacter sp.]|nr:DUF3189 family protein [Dethiobacter sp.]MCL5981687.1 DUF3189 family protein [Bacillota bacterium]
MAPKKIIYHCYGGAHSSVVAAAIHLGQLKGSTLPSNADFMRLTLFDRQTKDGHGLLHFFGFDEQGRQVYSLGCRNAGKTVEQVLLQVAEMIGAGGELSFIDTLHCVTLKMRIGGYLSRRWLLVRLGRPLVLSGTREAFPALVRLVEKVKNEVGT